MSDGGDLTIVIPLYLRSKNIARVHASARKTTPEAEILYVVSGDDPHYGDLAHEILPLCDDDHTVFLTIAARAGAQGDYARKINAGYRASDRPYIFTGADDLIFHDGWYDACLALMSETVGFVGTVDGGANARTMRGQHSTHSLVARWYADQGCSMDETEMIYHEGYWHEFCDDEAVGTARYRGAYDHAFDAVVEHRHMLLDASLDDDTYRHGRENTARSRMLHRRRRGLWGARGRIRNAPPRVVRR